MQKIKDFFKKVYSTLHKFFHNEKVLKALLLLYVFIFGCGVGGCIESFVNNKNTASAKTIINGSSLISDDILTYELGSISHIVFNAGSPSTREVMASLPTIVNFDFSGTLNDVDFYLSFGTTNAIFTNNMLNTCFSNYSLRINNTMMSDSNPFWGVTGLTINVADKEYSLDYMHIFEYRGNFNGVVESESDYFGFYYPKQVSYTTSGANGTLSATKNDSGVTYFIWGCEDTIQDSNRVIYYNRQRIDIPTTFTFNNGNTLRNTAFDLHTFITDTGAIYYYGYSIMQRYMPLTQQQSYNYTYTFSNVNYETGYEDGYNLGYGSGYTDGYIDGNDVGESDGYDIGYEQGYLQGSQVALEDANPFNAVLLYVDTFLNTKLFGSFSLGSVLSIVFGVLLITILLKVFMGG